MKQIYVTFSLFSLMLLAVFGMSYDFFVTSTGITINECSQINDPRDAWSCMENEINLKREVGSEINKALKNS